MKKKVSVAVALCVCLVFASRLDFQEKIKPECAFCKQKILESQTFYEGREVLGLITYKPAVPGHVLIIPKRHVERFENLTPSEASEMFSVIKKVDAVIKKIYKNEDYLLLQKNGPKAGQSVPHVHFHYIPGVHFVTLRYLSSYFFKPLNEHEIDALRVQLSGSFESF